MRRRRDGTVTTASNSRNNDDGTVLRSGSGSGTARKRRIGAARSSSAVARLPTAANAAAPRRLALFLLTACLACRTSRRSPASPTAGAAGTGLAHRGGVPLLVQAADVAVVEAPVTGADLGDDADERDRDIDSPTTRTSDDSAPLASHTPAAAARKLNVIAKAIRKRGGGAGRTVEHGGGVPPSKARRAAGDAGNLRRGGTTATAASAANGAAHSATQQPTQTLTQILAKAGKRGLGGGIPGFIAGVIQVLSLMWLRTVINYQCRYGTTFRQAIVTLFNDGGVPRFYRGLGFALIQAPLAKFVATAANDGVETLLVSMSMTQDWGPARGTVVSSVVVGLWRMALMPIDTCKTVLQVDSAEGFRTLMAKVKAGRIGLLYQGMFALAASSILSYYPWFYTYNFLSKSSAVQSYVRAGLVRNAFIGFVASVVSDVVSNCIRVVKTTKQSLGAKHAVSYGEVVSVILAADGWRGLFGRGLKTRILANAIQSVMFTIIWRGLAERWSADTKSSPTALGDEDTEEDDGGEY